MAKDEGGDNNTRDEEECITPWGPLLGAVHAEMVATVVWSQQVPVLLFRANRDFPFGGTYSEPKGNSLERISTKVILDGLKRNKSRGNSLSDEVDLSSVLGDTRAYLNRPVWE